MKKGIVFVIAFIVFLGIALAETREVKEVIDFPGMKKDQIFTKTVEWLAESFKSSKQVIEMQDKVSGKIVGNIVTEGRILISSVLYESKMIIEVKDYKARITFIPSTMTIEGTTRKLYGGEVDKAIVTLQSVKDSYMGYMKKADDSNW